MSGDGQTNYDEPAPEDPPLALARPISQEGRLSNTPFQTQRSIADTGIPRGQDRQDYTDAIKALEDQLGRKLTSKEMDAFLRTGSIPEPDVGDPTPVSETALRDAAGNLLMGGGGVPSQEEIDVAEDIAAAPFVGQQRANFQIPTAGSSGTRGPMPFQFENVFEEAFSSTTAKPDQNFAFNFGSRDAAIRPAMGMGRFRPRIV